MSCLCHRPTMESFPFIPSSTIWIFSSEENTLSVLRLISRTILLVLCFCFSISWELVGLVKPKSHIIHYVNLVHFVLMTGIEVTIPNAKKTFGINLFSFVSGRPLDLKQLNLTVLIFEAAYRLVLLELNLSILTKNRSHNKNLKLPVTSYHCKNTPFNE